MISHLFKFIKLRLGWNKENVNESMQLRRRKKNGKTRDTDSNDDESDIDMSLRESSTSSIDEELSLQSADDSDSVCDDPLQVTNDSFVLVKFEKKNTVLYYVGKFFIITVLQNIRFHF
ncbi:hypothetical protein JTB14_017605 [Gonioctena quinquepunctata]|nr:hypothetical protein JTB14_017605 [Gonioctena quinquepunctata]